jgi:CheY-like chemotaxis protein
MPPVAIAVLGCRVVDKAPRSPRVLCVEDDSATRAGYIAYLAGRGYDVRAAATGEEALALASAWAPQVIVLDLGLPDVDGWEVARRLKAAAPTLTIPIIALTGADLPHERVSAMRAGCDRHLTKPCRPADLVDAIERCLSGT